MDFTRFPPIEENPTVEVAPPPPSQQRRETTRNVSGDMSDSFSDVERLRPPREKAPSHGLPPPPDRVDGADSSDEADARDLEYSVMKLVSEKVFMDLMKEPLARHRFREFLESTAEGTTAFDAWLDIRAFKKETDELHVGSVAISDLYLTSDATASRLPVPDSMKDRLLEAFSLVAKIDVSLDAPARHLLGSLYNQQFQAFIRYKLVETASVRLGKYNLSQREREGLGDCAS
ncbi:hypothetical protein RQP46_003224 [Phenoliferia psychrophenolica]